MERIADENCDSCHGKGECVHYAERAPDGCEYVSFGDCHCVSYRHTDAEKEMLARALAKLPANFLTDNPMSKKPSRTDLLGAISSLQGLIGRTMAVNNDRNPNRKAQVDDLLGRAHQLCIDARSDDPPSAGSKSTFYNRDNTTTAI